ncbi:methyltransferase family protein [Edaphobacter bradus]|uniref:methyltransferase family protein n=1 Tax=Edaphobacter bradus TaxID=2259016 RepID=UPI0021DFEB44|nr:isoprenylcysteine carboxylmethyltransferase family protein [Edaphobacter bradus]
MRPSAFVFRYRLLVHAVIFLLAFTVPWDRWLRLDLDANGSTWLLLSTWTARNHWLSFSAATVAFLVFGAGCALAAALLRTWAAAYIGYATVQSPLLHGDRVVAAGPYRYLRNPLYLGTIVHTFGLALLMPPSGAIFALVFVTGLELVLIACEEPFLTAKLGDAYTAYRARVPRIVPALTPRVPQSEMQAHWKTAFPAEIYYWGFFLTWLVVGWKYNASLMTQGVLISLGVALVVRALLPRQAEKA